MTTLLPSSPREVRRGPMTRPAPIPPPQAEPAAAETAAAPRPEEIAELAYARFIARGGEHGHDVEDWLEAERTLRQARNGAAPVPGVV